MTRPAIDDDSIPKAKVWEANGPHPLAVVFEEIRFSRTGLAGLSNVPVHVINEIIAGRRTKIPGAIMEALRPYIDVDQLAKDQDLWFAAQPEDVRTIGENWERHTSCYGFSVVFNETTYRDILDINRSYQAERKS